MKKLNLMALAMLAAAVTVSCSKDEVTDVSPSRVIGFNALTNNSIERSGETDKTNFLTFRIYGCVTKAGDPTQEHVTLFFADQVTNKNGVWSYTDPRYWAENKDYYFVALSTNAQDANNWTYTPNSSHPAGSLSVSGFKGYGELSFDNQGAGGERDLIYAYKAVTTSGQNLAAMPKVGLDFNHLLSRVGVNIKNEINSKYTFQVKNIVIGGSIGAAKIADLATISWVKTGETTANIKVPDMNTVDYVAFNDSYLSTKLISSSRFLIPGTQSLTISFELDAYLTGANGEKVLSSTHSLSGTLAEKTYEPGHSYLFNVSITADNIVDGGAKPIEFNVTSVAGWTDGAGSEITLD